MTDRTLVIVGASLAGAKAAEAARRPGFDGRIVLVGDEPSPLRATAAVQGRAARRGGPETTRVHDDGYYAANDIELLTGRTVEALDLDSGRVRLDGDEHVPFSAVVLATGAEPPRLDVPGADLAGVHYLRDLGDALRLGDAVARGRVAVIGAGWIGSEVAASARQMGAEVVLIDPAPVPLQRVLGHEIGEVFRAARRQRRPAPARRPASSSCGAPAGSSRSCSPTATSRPPTSWSSASASPPAPGWPRRRA